MRLVRREVLNGTGPLASSAERHTIEAEINAAISRVEWPPGSGSFTLYPERPVEPKAVKLAREAKGLKKPQYGNGVRAIKAACMTALVEFGWQTERPLKILKGTRPGPVDAVRQTAHGPFVCEWETGNISSSHRALNKIYVGLLHGVIAGGVLIVPDRAMYQYLTDRIGNEAELEPYFIMWRKLGEVVEGLVEVAVVTYDATSTDVPKIPRGADGMALLAK